MLVWPTVPSFCQDNGATRDGSTQETSDLNILLTFCGLKRLTKLVSLTSWTDLGKNILLIYWDFIFPPIIIAFAVGREINKNTLQYIAIYWDASCMVRYYFLSGFQMGYALGLGRCWPAGYYLVYSKIIIYIPIYGTCIPMYLRAFLPMLYEFITLLITKLST